MAPVHKCQVCQGNLELSCPRCTQHQHHHPARHSNHLRCCTIISTVGVATLAVVLSTWTGKISLHTSLHHQADCLVGEELCYIYGTGRGLEVAVVGERNSATVHIVNQTGQECSKATDELSCEISSISQGEGTSCVVNKMKGSPVYEIRYQPANKGRHKLSFKFASKRERVKERVFDVYVLRKLGTPTKIIRGVIAPQGMTLNERGELIVAEYREHCVSIFDQSGEKRWFGSKGSHQGEFYYPCDVAVDSRGDILVADGKNHRIQKFTSNGVFIQSVGTHGRGKLEFDFPVGIGVHPHTKLIYVTENKNNRIQVLNPDLTFSSYLHGNFNQPKDLAFDSAGNVYIADNENHQIKIFDEDGGFLRQFGKEGTDEGELNYPTGVSVDRDGVVYVVELYNYRVSLFTREGKFLSSFGSKGSGAGQFINPRGVAVDRNGTVYISDHENERIQLF